MSEDLMHLDKSNFFSRLALLLRHLAGSDFVSIDFELSGIPTKYGSTADAATRPGKPTVQQRYEEMKAAAEKYTILQVGITLAAQSEQGGGYFLQPYNINLNPNILERMDIDRDISMSSSAIQFLISSGFQIDRPFTDGVPYLSREEEATALRLETSRHDGKHQYQDMIVDQRDTGLQDFVSTTRQSIKNWKPKNSDASMMITGGDAPFRVGLSRMQRGLVHQMVRKEFKDKYVAITTQECIKILVHDAEREAKVKKNRIAAFRQRLSRQVGFRWFMEGLVGGELSDIDPYEIYAQPNIAWLNLNHARAELSELCEDLKGRRPALVGHNMFMDLIFMYKTFYGPLPAKVTDFARTIHELFPLVIDTKFLCTHSGNADGTSLQELIHELDLQELPEVYDRPGYTRYAEAPAFHEAGYDAWQTARLLIKTGAKLAGTTNWRRGVSKGTKLGTSRPLRPRNSAGFEYVSNSSSAPAASSLQGVDDSEPSVGPSLMEHAKQARAFHASRTHNPPSQAGFPAHLLPLEQFHLLPKPEPGIDSDPWRLPDPGRTEGRIPAWLPPWDHEFWLLFGNKIRINGTQEAMLDMLAKNDDKVVAE